MEVCKKIKDVTVYAAGEFSNEELEAYVDYALEREGENLEGIDVKPCENDEVELTYHLKKAVPFERIRRITGR